MLKKKLLSQVRVVVAILLLLGIVAISQQGGVEQTPKIQSQNPAKTFYKAKEQEVPRTEKNDSTLQPSSVQRNLPEKPELEKQYWFIPKRVSLSHSEGAPQGLAYTTNYTTLAALFGPDYKLGRTLPLVDLRVHRFNDNSYAANAGIVLRYIPKTFCQVIGFNAYYDYREGFTRPHNQVGFGLEVLSKRWDLRANVYAPVGDLKQTKSCLFNQYEGGYYIFNRRTESSFYSINAEAGWLVVNSDPFLLYWATGPYYLSGKFNDRAAGWEMRVRPQIKDYFAVDLRVSYDPLFKTVFQAQFFVTIPLYQLSSRKGKSGPCGMTDRQIYQPVERFEVPPIKRRSCWKKNF